MASFSTVPTPGVLHRLSGGQLANRLQRAVRCWVWLEIVYGDRTHQTPLPDRFRYRDLRDRALAPSHPTDDRTPGSTIDRHCRGSQCLCQVTTADLLFRRHPDLSPDDWVAQVTILSGLETTVLQGHLQQRPFATVHRTLRDDLAWLADQGWLAPAGRGQWAKVAPEAWPTLIGQATSSDLQGLSTRDQRDLMHLLESVAFLQPQLAVMVNTLWDQLHSSRTRRDAPRRLFVHLDYILSETAQEQVDQHQHDIEDLWNRPDGGVIQFDYYSGRRQQRFQVTGYPVCLHYARRAKYLTVYGHTPQGTIDWWNYRLDRITSNRITTLPWGDPAVPSALHRRRQQGTLPTPEEVDSEIKAAWGFNFYLPKALLILRFAPEFARWYVDDTDRHSTFAPVAYDDLPELIATQAPPGDRDQLLRLVAQLPPTDVYYRAWVRLGDTNVTMRLRDWRPNGEVIAPLAVRQQMMQEATQELNQYRRSELPAP